MIINKNQFTIKEGQALVNEFYGSQLKGSEFCKKKNISYHILQYWRARCTKQPKISAATNANFLPITPLSIASNKTYVIKIIINAKTVIELPVEIDLLHLKKILEVCATCG